MARWPSRHPSVRRCVRTAHVKRTDPHEFHNYREFHNPHRFHNPDDRRPVTTTAESGVTSPRSSRQRVPGRTRLDFWLDLSLFLAFSLDYSFNFTGLTIHEWIGLGFGLSLLTHLTLHWDWVVRTTSRMFGRLAGRERLRWFVDLALLGAMTSCVASGVLISRAALPSLHLTPTGGAFWTGLHTTTADVTIVLVGLHVGLNWRWIVTVGRRILARPAAPTP